MGDRHQFRADWNAYKEGVFFITICCSNKIHYFGEVVDGKMIYSPVGEMASQVLAEMDKHFSEVEIWNSVIMPNHLHIVMKVGKGHNSFQSSASNMGCLKPKRHEPQISQDFHHNSRVSIIIGQFKSTIKRLANRNKIQFEWQPRFHEHIIRNQHSYENIMNYVDGNVKNWCNDCFNQHRPIEKRI